MYIIKNPLNEYKENLGRVENRISEFNDSSIEKHLN